MNEHDLTHELGRLVDEPIEPPGGFREDLRLLIRDEFGSSVTGVSPIEVNRDSPDAGSRNSGDERRVVRPVWVFAAAFAVVVALIGSLALIRFPEGETTVDDVNGSALSTVFVEPTVVPAGLELELAVTGYFNSEVWLWFEPTGGAGDLGNRDLSIRTSVRITNLPAGTAAAVDRLTRAYPDAEVTATTVRGQQAFLVEARDADTYGWTTAVVVVESPQLLSEVRGSNIDADEILAVAGGLQSTTKGDFDAWSAPLTDWDLLVDAATGDVNGFVNQIENTPGVGSVSIRPQRPLSLVSLELQRPDAEPPVTTTPVDTQVTAQPVPVEVLIHLEPDTDPELIAAQIYDFHPTATIQYSAPVIDQLTTTYLSAVLTGAEMVAENPTIYQPTAGPEPQFDTTTLGTEIPLMPATASAGLPASTEQIATNPFNTVATPGAELTTLTGPILHIGSVGDTRLLLTFDGGPDYLEKTYRQSQGGINAGSLRYYTYGQTGADFTQDHGSMTIRVPLETSVVAVEFTGGAVWQRPIAGYALIPVDAGLGDALGTITALDTHGAIIDQWQTREG